MLINICNVKKIQVVSIKKKHLEEVLNIKHMNASQILCIGCKVMSI